MRRTLLAVGFYGLMAGLLLAISVLLTGARAGTPAERVRADLGAALVPPGAARDPRLALFTVYDLRLASGDSLDLLLQWMPPAQDSASAWGAVDTLVAVFHTTEADGSGGPVIVTRERRVPLYAIDRSWTQRVSIPRLAGSAWSVITAVQGCAVVKRVWPSQAREVWGPLTCGLAQYVERRRYDQTVRVYREDPNPFDLGPGWDRYPPVPRVPAADSIRPRAL